MAYYINPKRLSSKRNIFDGIIFWIKQIAISPLAKLGFKNIDYYYVHGEGGDNCLNIGKNVSTADAIFNISSGNITVGENTVFGHNVFVITGFHRYYKGKLAKLYGEEAPREVPQNGHDIIIGSGCFIGSNAQLLSGIQIGDNVIVGAGSIVTKDVPNNVMVAGIPAKIIRINE